MKNELIKMYSNIVQEVATISKAQKLKVGSIAVKGNRIISIGVNGQPPGWDNICEDVLPDGSLKTKDSVIHSEANMIGHLIRDGESAQGATIFVTHSPCIQCAKILFTAGIKDLYYIHEYRLNDGIQFLEQCGIPVCKINV